MHLSIKLASPYTDKENGIQGEGRGSETKKTQKTPFIAHPTLAQPICKRQVTLQLAILQTKQMNEALQVAQKGKDNVFQHPIHSDIKHQQNFHKGCFILKGKGINA